MQADVNRSRTEATGDQRVTPCELNDDASPRLALSSREPVSIYLALAPAAVELPRMARKLPI